MELCAQQSSRGFNNGIAAIVNNKVITAESVLRELPMEVSRVYSSLPISEREKYKQLALKGLIRKELMLSDYREKGYNLPDSIFEQRIKETIQREGHTRSSLIKNLRSQGQTFDEYAKDYREQMIHSIMRSEFISTKGIVISPRKIEEYYIANKNQYRQDREIKLRMIVLENSKHGGAASTRSLADEIHAKLADAESFTQMAQIHSDQNNATGGLRAQWDKKGGSLHPSLEKAAFALGQGQVSSVVEISNGCFIMRCEEIRQTKLKSLSEVRDEIEDNLIEQARKERADKWFKKLEAKAYIQIFSF
jgi:parvulin-like peptidyl-prolyl isomerase